MLAGVVAPFGPKLAFLDLQVYIDVSKTLMNIDRIIEVNRNNLPKNERLIDIRGW